MILRYVFRIRDVQPNGQWLKFIAFRLPILEEDMNLSLDDDKHAETVCQLVRKDAGDGVVGNAGSSVKRKVNYREEEIVD